VTECDGGETRAHCDWVWWRWD